MPSGKPKNGQSQNKSQNGNALEDAPAVVLKTPFVFALSLRKACRIRFRRTEPKVGNPMSRSVPITEAELAAIKRSVVDAWGRFVPAHMGFFLLGKPGEIIKLDREFLLKARCWFFGKKLFPLNSPRVKQLLIEAIDSGDEKFFIKLGRALSRKQVLFLGNRPPNDLEIFLLKHWAESKDGMPQLFYLTPAALTRLCRSKLRKAGLSEDVVVKTRQRLRLKPFKRQKRDVSLHGNK